MNQRMHNKMLVADNRAVILGGRNIGNEYFGFSHASSISAISMCSASARWRDRPPRVFDRFWNSDWVIPVSALELDATRRTCARKQPRILRLPRRFARTRALSARTR